MPPRKVITSLSVIALAAVAAGGLASCGSKSSTPTTLGASLSITTYSTGNQSNGSDVTVSTSKPTVVVPDTPAPTTLQTKDLVVGTGAEAKSGQSVKVQYVGVSYSTKKEFDASWNSGKPFTFVLGGGQVIKGWDQGVAGMKVGGRRELIIPPDLGYGAAGAGGAIAPNETLVFVVDLLNVS